MAQSKDERNRKRREKYAADRAAGKSRNEARGGGKPKTTKKSSSSAPKGRKPPKFETYAKKHLDKSATAIVKEYRKKYGDKGGKIGNVKGKEIVRNLKGLEYQEQKRTRFKWYPNGKQPGAVKKYIKEKYMVVVEYKVDREGFVEPETRYATIAKDRRMTQREIVDAVYQMVDELEQDSPDHYRVEGIVDGSVKVLYGVVRD